MHASMCAFECVHICMYIGVHVCRGQKVNVQKAGHWVSLVVLKPDPTAHSLSMNPYMITCLQWPGLLEESLPSLSEKIIPLPLQFLTRILSFFKKKFF